jgi:hypothetical protein
MYKRLMQNRGLNDKCINGNKGSLDRVKMCGKGGGKVYGMVGANLKRVCIM